MTTYGVQTAFIVYSIAELVCFLPMIVLMFKGASWRDNDKGPEWNMDL
jgi:hypothetical protein